MNNEFYKRLAKVEAMAEAQKSEQIETLKASYERACDAHNEEDAAAFARMIRNKLLEQSDAQLAIDRLGLTVPTGTSFEDWLPFLRGIGDVLAGSWSAYRQALRDLPEQEGFPFAVTFPLSPDEEALLSEEEPV